MNITFELPIALGVAATFIKFLMTQNLHTQDITEKGEVLFAISKFEYVMQPSAIDGGHFAKTAKPFVFA